MLLDCLARILDVDLESFKLTLSSCTLHGAKGSSNSGGVYSSRSSRKLNGKVKGNLTRDFERLDDELALHEVHINSHSNVGLISGDHKSSSPSLP